MGNGSDTPHEDMLMFGTVERPHPAIALGPNADIEQRIIDVTTRRQDLREMTPVHEGKMHSTRNADIRHIAENELRNAVNSVSVISPEAIAKSR